MSDVPDLRYRFCDGDEEEEEEEEEEVEWVSLDDSSFARAWAASSCVGMKSLSRIAPLSGGMCFLDHSAVVVFVKSGGGIGGGSKSGELLEGEEDERELEEDMLGMRRAGIECVGWLEVEWC
jgi:hypothetical protein